MILFDCLNTSFYNCRALTRYKRKVLITIKVGSEGPTKIIG
jgi:hypothetical protein